MTTARAETGDATVCPHDGVVGYVVATATGGMSRHVRMLASGCAARGWRVVVFGPDAVRRHLTPDAAGVTFHPLDVGDRPRPAEAVHAVLLLRRLLGVHAVTVVHAHGLRAGAVAAAARTLPGTGQPPLVVTVHNAPPDGAVAGGIYRALEPFVARTADEVLCVSRDLEARMRRAGARRVGRALVPAVDRDRVGAAPTEAIAAVRDELRVADGERSTRRPVILAVGRLAPQKGFDVLVAAARRWRDLRPMPLLVLVGAGPLAGSLAAAAAPLGDAVRLLGERADIPALLACADVVVVPSRWEGQPLVVQEALLAGRPIVASRVGGIADLTGDDAAVLVPPGDPEHLAAAVRRVLTDPVLAARLTTAAHNRARNLPSVDDAVDAALACYRRLADAPGEGTVGGSDAPERPDMLRPRGWRTPPQRSDR